MKGKVIFTSPDHNFATRQIFPSLQIPLATKLEVGEQCNRDFLGFGLALTPASCYTLSLMERKERDALLRQLYTKDGVGLGVGRVCIGACDYSPEIYSYDDYPGDTALEHFSIARDEEYVIPMIKEILNVNPDLYLFASPWSPPFWMKTGGSACGGYMRDEFLDCYSDYIIKFLQAYEANGIHISALTPQNETNCDGKYKMPACVWHPETEAKFIKILRRKLMANGMNVKIWMYDHNFDDVMRVSWSLENCGGLKDACDGVAFHYYAGTIEQTLPLMEKFPKLEYHFTEGGPRLTDNYDTDWCKWGLMAIKALKYGYCSFTGWNLILDELGGPNVGPHMGICGGFVTRDNRDGQLSHSGQYKAFSHIAPYISPRSKIYPIFVDKAFDTSVARYPKQDRKIEGIVIDNGDGKLIAIAVNPNHHNIQSQIELFGQLWYLEFRADSIATIIVEK